MGALGIAHTIRFVYLIMHLFESTRRRAGRSWIALGCQPIMVEVGYCMDNLLSLLGTLHVMLKLLLNNPKGRSEQNFCVRTILACAHKKRAAVS